jgi:hypothetical protein
MAKGAQFKSLYISVAEGLSTRKLGRIFRSLLLGLRHHPVSQASGANVIKLFSSSVTKKTVL